MKDPAIVRGGTEFYWIAGLGLANTLLGWFMTYGFESYFNTWVQLKSDLYFNLEVYKHKNLTRGMGILYATLCSGGVASVFLACGLLARRGLKLAFLAGLGLYALDTIALLINAGYDLTRFDTLNMNWWVNIFVHGYFMFILIALLRRSGKSPASALEDSMLNAPK